MPYSERARNRAAGAAVAVIALVLAAAFLAVGGLGQRDVFDDEATAATSPSAAPVGSAVSFHTEPKAR